MLLLICGRKSCLAIVEEKANELLHEKKKINVDPILKYFKSTWMDGKYKKDFWNYFDYIGRRTNNDLEAFNRQLNRFLRSPKPNIFKFVQHIQGVDQSVSLQIIAYRKNPVDYGSRWGKSKAQRESEEKFIKLKVAYIAKSLELYDYLYAVAANVELTMFIDEDGNVDPVNVLEDVVEVVEQDTALHDDNNSIVEDLENLNLDLNSNILDNSAYLQMREEEHEADI